ncbi:MAG: tetratricopeptide repeat-containing sensor histidine kinase [Patiriisocius sp.]|uniref:tetratricopeptide repeat-containing sensor histidine kinase n=1 Tax=Patiriisocius sp. TaxID=2822396 RepID=UPI003EF26834
MNRNQLLWICLLLFFSTTVFAQNTLKNIDSVLQVLKNKPQDTSKAILFQEIAGHYNITHLDSAQPFARKGLLLSKKLNFKRGEWMNLSMLGNYHERKTQYDSASFYYSQALKIIKVEKSIKGEAIVYNNIGMLNIRTGDYDDAIANFFKSMDAEERLGNKTGIAEGLNNIGVAHYYMANYDKATEYLLQALQAQKELGNTKGLQQGYNNVGAIFDYQKKYKQAIATYEKALAISRELGDKKLEASNLTNIALAYSKNEEFEKADDYFEEALAVRTSIGDKTGLAHSYSSFGESLRQQKRFDISEKYLKEGLVYAEENKLKLSMKETYSSLAELYKDQNKKELESEFLRKYISINDSILDETKAKAIAELETKYETEIKEKEILEQRAKLAEKEIEVTQKNNLIYGSLSLAVILGLLGYLVYNQQRLKNRQLKKEGELKEALASIETQNKLQEQRLRISRDLHDNIGAQLTFIISSLDNLKFGFPEMKEKLANKLGSISQFTGQTIYELRDTIWAMNKEEISFEDLQVRIANFVEKAKGISNTSVDFIVDHDISKNVTLSSIVGMNVYRIIQEGVNNAVKYANANAIVIQISEEKNNYKVVVKDDGSGYNPAEIEMGNGLSNMKKRARDIQGEILFTSEIGNGTTIDLNFPK